MSGSVIVGGAWTPIGKLSRALKGFSAMDLGGIAIREALARAGGACCQRYRRDSWQKNGRPRPEFCHRGVAVSNSVTTAESDASRTAVFATGHLGELTWQVPVELVDAVLAETKTTQRRLRDLPSRVGLNFVLTCCLFWATGRSGPTLRRRKSP
jgi:hypothetical protein